MPASVTLRSGVVIPVAETAAYVHDQIVAAYARANNGEPDTMVELHLDDRGNPGNVLYAKAAAVEVAIDTSPA